MNTDAEYDRICEYCISIETNSVTNHLATDLILNEERQLPVLLFTGNVDNKDLADEMAERLMGFCHVFIIADRQFNRLFKARLQNNDIELKEILD